MLYKYYINIIYIYIYIYIYIHAYFHGVHNLAIYFPHIHNIVFHNTVLIIFIYLGGTCIGRLQKVNRVSTYVISHYAATY